MGGSNHSSVNHIANATSKAVYVKTGTDKRYVRATGWSASAHYKGAGGGFSHHSEYDWQRCEKEGFTRVSAGRSLRMHPDTHSSHTVYVTIIDQDGHIPAHCWPTTEDGGVIVIPDHSGPSIKESVPGNKWKDYQGKIW